jgi:hypothetical protein
MKGTTMSTKTQPPTNAAEFIGDLDGGNFIDKFGAALGFVASHVVDHDKTGEVVVKFSMKKIPGTSQVHVEHELKFKHPTEAGSIAETLARTTPMHVGKFGALSLAPPNQLAFLDRQGNPLPKGN